MIFYYANGGIIEIADFNKKKNLTIDNNEDLNRYINRNKKEVWVCYDQADLLKNVVTVYDVKDGDYSIDYKVNSYCVDSKLEAVVKEFFENYEIFKCKLKLINKFKLPNYLLNSTIAKITAYAIGGTPERNNEFDYKLLNILTKYNKVREFFDNNRSYGKKFNTTIAGVEHTYGFGGCHGARKGYVSRRKIAVIDAKSFYPTMLARFGYYNITNKERAKYIHEMNIKLTGNERLPYKLADNSIVGNFKNQYSDLYNPRASNTICINGQILITSLIEFVEGCSKLIQTNTDGIIVEYSDLDKLTEACKSWERATKFELKIDTYDKIYQKDVNNYLLVGRKIKGVGELREVSEGNYTESIIKRSMRAYLLDNVPVAKTINECKDAREFQILAKPNYKVYANWYGSRIKNVFSFEVSNDFKFVDKQHYIKTAGRRLKKYGVTL